MRPAAARCREPGVSWTDGAAAVLLLAVTLLVYKPAMQAGYVGDDEAYVVQNSTLHSADGLWQIWFNPAASPQYYPLAFTTFWIEHHLWGLDAAGYHIVNVVMHGINALLVWWLLRRVRVPGAWLAAAVFALHPVHVESVAWISERKDVLSGLLFFLALVAWLRFADSHCRRHFAAVVLLFAAALLSKTMTLTLPLLIVLLEWWQDPARVRRQVPWVLALLPLSVAAIYLTTWSEYLVDRSDMVMRALAWVDRPLIAGRAFWFYLGKLLWPVPLMPYYPRWQIDATALWQYCCPLSVVALVVTLWSLRHRLGRGPLAAALFFLISLGPVLGFVNFNFMTFAYVADHLQYLPSIAPITLIAAALTTASRAAGFPRPLAPVTAGALLVVLGALTWQHAGTCHDVETQMRDCLAKNPAAAAAHYNLGTLLLQRGELAGALPHFVEAVRYKPDYGDAQNNWGMVLWRQQKPEDAIPHFAAAARLYPFDFRPHQNLAGVLADLGKADAAIEQYTEALRLNPASVATRLELGALLLTQNQPAAAATQFAEAVRLDPENTQARRSWAQVLELQGQMDAAMEQYARVLRAEPSDATMQSALATYLLQHGRFEESLPHFAMADQLQPEQADVHNNWGAALGELGRVDEAIAQFKEALRINPSGTDVQGNLQKALAHQGERGLDTQVEPATR